MTGAPAYVRNGRADILAANRLGYALYSEISAGPARPANTARFVFLDPRATGFFVDWDRVASVVGDLQLTYEVLDLSADPGLSLVVYGAEPGSASQDGLHLLARRAATLDQAATAQTPDQA
jgi:hypothetical protein